MKTLNKTNQTTIWDLSKEREIIKSQTQIIKSLQDANIRLLRDFEVEKNCKNQVYYFILNAGLLEEYQKYTLQNPVEES